jgi:hypothetical protein
MSYEIKEITQQEAFEILESVEKTGHYTPLGLFWHKSEIHGKTSYIGIDNSNGDAWTEDFDRLDNCLAWLNGIDQEVIEFVRKLKICEYRYELTKDHEKEAKELGMVVVFGASDDLMEFRGALNNEFDCYGGGVVYLDKDGLLKVCESQCNYYQKALEASKKIKAVWCGENSDGWTWTYETEIPHATFEIYDDDEKYCLGIVFRLYDLEV